MKLAVSVATPGAETMGPAWKDREPLRQRVTCLALLLPFLAAFVALAGWLVLWRLRSTTSDGKIRQMICLHYPLWQFHHAFNQKHLPDALTAVMVPRRANRR